MALTSNGKILLIVDINGFCLIINFPKQVIISHFNFRGKVSCLKISPDDNFVAVSLNKSLRIYEMPKMTKEYEPFVLYRNYTAWHSDKITCLNWSHDSRFVLTGGKDTSVRLLNVFKIKDYVPLMFTGHKKKVVNCVFSEDMNRIYSISQDGVMFIWKYVSEKSKEYIKALTFERRVKGNKNLKSKEELTNEEEDENDNDDKEDEYYSEYETKIMTGRYILEKKQQFNTNSKVVICEINTSTNVNDNILVLGIQTGEFAIYSMNTFDNKYTLKISDAKITSISINQEGTWIAFGSKYLSQLLVWEWKSESYIYKQQGHFYDISTIAYSPDSSQIASGAIDGRIKVWNTSNASCIITFNEHKSKVTEIKYAPNKPSVLVSASLDGTVRAYDLIKYRNFRVMTTPKVTQFTCVGINLSGEIVAAGSMDPYVVYVWNLKTGDLVDQLTGHTAPISCIAFSANKDMVATGSWDKTVKFWELYAKKGIGETYEHNSKILAVTISPDDKEVAVSTLNGELYTWDVETGSIKAIIDTARDIWGGRLDDEKVSAKNSKRTKHLNSICYNLSGNLLLCGGNSQYVLLYDTQYQILVKKFTLTHNRSLNGILYKLNSKNYGKKDEYYDSEDELEANNKMRQRLPGANITSNELAPEIKITSVQFSNTNREWAVGTTEGIFIFSLDKSLTFSKLSLDMNIKTADAVKAFEEGSYLKGIIFSFYLNKTDILDKYYKTIPISHISLVANKIPFNVVGPFLDFLCVKLENDSSIELIMNWVFEILKVHGENLKNVKNKSVFLNLQKSLNKMFVGMENLVNDNIYKTKYLTEYEGNADDEEMTKEDD